MNNRILLFSMCCTKTLNFNSYTNRPWLMPFLLFIFFSFFFLHYSRLSSVQGTVKKMQNEEEEKVLLHKGKNNLVAIYAHTKQVLQQYTHGLALASGFRVYFIPFLFRHALLSVYMFTILLVFALTYSMTALTTTATWIDEKATTCNWHFFFSGNHNNKKIEM